MSRRAVSSALASLGKLAALGVTACLFVANTVDADTLDADPAAGYVPIDELSYETIIRPGTGFEAELAIRVALHNTSAATQDMVMALAIPHGSELTGIAIARGGDWIVGEVSTIEDDAGDVARGRRDPGTVFVRELAPENPGDQPGAEIVAFGLPSQTTTQVELRLRVHPHLRGDRWQLDLPRRNAEIPNLVDQRRVIVQGLPEGQSFWVDDTPSNGTPYMVTRSEDAITVSWSAARKSSAELDGSYEVSRDPDGDGGRLRVILRLGPSKPIAPDHVLLVVDRSQSGSSSMPRESARMFTQLLDSLPAGTTFDAITFARTADRLLDPKRFASGKAPRVDDAEARTELSRSLEITVPGQGTDLRAAMELAGQQLAARKAKQPLILVVTDGMLPPSVGADTVGKALGDALGKAARPEVLFVVDDPLLNLRGLPADHPIASLAAGLGARISLETLANLGPDSVDELLAAPKVLGDLQVNLPSSVLLDEPLPSGLVAGDFLVVEGSYDGRAPSKVTIRGRFGKSKVAASFSAAKREPRPAAIAAAIREDDRPRAVEEGLAMPDWYTASMRRVTSMNIAQAGRVGWQPTGQLDSNIIERQLRSRVLPRARACYNQALTRNQVLAGRVELQLEVGKGEVMMAGLG
ncbi:MAG TPA: VWA domain-containing protein, partial [Enhygromyxa sp.]|nr:VWA domain-containing protein [Enhygromyxa sp.]